MDIFLDKVKNSTKRKTKTLHTKLHIKRWKNIHISSKVYCDRNIKFSKYFEITW